MTVLAMLFVVHRGDGARLDIPGVHGPAGCDDARADPAGEVTPMARTTVAQDDHVVPLAATDYRVVTWPPGHAGYSTNAPAVLLSRYIPQRSSPACRRPASRPSQDGGGD